MELVIETAVPTPTSLIVYIRWRGQAGSVVSVHQYADESGKWSDPTIDISSQFGLSPEKAESVSVALNEALNQAALLRASLRIL